MARKSENSTVRRQVDAIADVEFDTKHTDSPLCACRECNDEWLTRRDRPLSKKHTYEVRKTMNPERLGHYAPQFASRGLALRVAGSEWRMFPIKDPDSWFLTTAFDLDLDRVLRQLDEGRTFREVDLTFHAAPVVKTTTNFDPITGGPFCVMCGEPATLFCPNLVKRAELLDVRLFFPVGDARLRPARLHPGRCRKRLGQLLQAAQEARTGVKVVSK